MTIFLICFLLLGLSFGLTYLIRVFAIKKAILDIPNDRSSHSVPTPRGGGIAIAISWLIGLCILFFTGKIEDDLFYALLSGLPLAIIGFIDDVVSLNPGIRFLVQVLSATLAIFFLHGMHFVDIWIWHFNHIIPLSCLAFVAIIWFTNLFNFLDGIDGYISTEVIFIGLVLFIITGNVIGLILLASVLGFLFWNWQKAKIFMGDVGSTLLGFNVAVLLIYFNNLNSMSIYVGLILTSVFWFDATVTLFRRFKNKEHLSVAHRKHAFQRIVQAGFSHQKTVLYALGLNIIGVVLAFCVLKFGEYGILFLGIDLLILFVVLKQVDRLKPFSKD
jgi:UDP-N-acetylmuramyl pentapeptide phosphotransferase/UDP-N-acetylglucosamine-1-phosphate transferase